MPELDTLSAMYLHNGGANRIYTVRPLSRGERHMLHTILKGATCDKVYCDRNKHSIVYSAAVPAKQIGAWAEYLERVMQQLVNIRIVPEKEHNQYDRGMSYTGRYRIRVYFRPGIEPTK
jgi:hypothetical protein